MIIGRVSGGLLNTIFHNLRGCWNYVHQIHLEKNIDQDQIILEHQDH